MLCRQQIPKRTGVIVMLKFAVNIMPHFQPGSAKEEKKLITTLKHIQLSGMG